MDLTHSVARGIAACTQALVIKNKGNVHACTLEPQRRFVTERGKRSPIYNPGLLRSAWVITLSRAFNSDSSRLLVQAVLAAKEIEVEQYKSLVEELQQQITGLQLDADKSSLAMLHQVKIKV